MIVNDYELLYLYQEGNVDLIFDFLVEKYKGLIWATIHKLKIWDYKREDYYQEGLICLYKAVQTYSTAMDKTFLRYFEIILKRRYYKILSSQNINFEYYESMDIFVEHYRTPKTTITAQDLDHYCKTPLEKLINKLYYGEVNTPRQISELTKLPIKSVYNAINRIKIKRAKLIS
jgi:RNA polymerase sporulation-specific sigma factor